MKWMDRLWALLVLAVAAVLGALLCGRIVGAKQVQTVMLLAAMAALLVLAGTLAFVACDAETPLWVVTVLYGVRICGVACLQMPMTAYASKQLSGDDVAQGTAITTSIRQISSALLSSVLIGIMALASSGDLGIDAYGFGVAFSILAALTVAGFIFGAAFLPKRRKASGRR